MKARNMGKIYHDSNHSNWLNEWQIDQNFQNNLILSAIARTELPQIGWRSTPRSPASSMKTHRSELMHDARRQREKIARVYARKSSK